MALMTGDPGTAATAIKEGGSTQPLTFISSSKTESNKLLAVLDRTFRFLFLVGSLVEVFTGDLVSFTFTAELLSLAPTTFHLALLLLFLCEEVVAGLRLGSLEELLVKEVSCLLFELELLLPVEPDSCR
jgi:hypothetical protein